MQQKKECRCGYGLDSPMIIPKTRYNKKGYLMLSMGYSAKPIEVVFQCQNCSEIIDSSDEPDIIEKYRYNSDIIR